MPEASDPTRKKLTPGEVWAIRHSAWPASVIAREFRVSLSTVHNIRARLSRTDVPDEPKMPHPIGGGRRLTPAQVRAIRASTGPLRVTAAQYGISAAAVRLIRRREQIYLDIGD